MSKRTRVAGPVGTKDRLVAFLYLLLRDRIQPGDLEKVMKDVSESQQGEKLDTWILSNAFLAEYAKDIAERLAEE